MSDDNINNQEDSKEQMYTKEDIENAIKARIAREKEAAANALDKKEMEKQAALQEAQKYKEQLDSLKSSSNSSFPANDNSSTQNVDSLTAKDVEDILARRENEKKEQARQQAAWDIIGKAAQEDPEFNKLAQGEGYMVPHQHAVEMISLMGKNALPIIKKAMQDSKINAELNGHQNVGSLVAWAH